VGEWEIVYGGCMGRPKMPGVLFIGAAGAFGSSVTKDVAGLSNIFPILIKMSSLLELYFINSVISMQISDHSSFETKLSSLFDPSPILGFICKSSFQFVVYLANAAEVSIPSKRRSRECTAKLTIYS
jgi:hypothetical protein